MELIMIIDENGLVNRYVALFIWGAIVAIAIAVH
jgi:hypothetical protein